VPNCFSNDRADIGFFFLVGDLICNGDIDASIALSLSNSDAVGVCGWSSSSCVSCGPPSDSPPRETERERLELRRRVRDDFDGEPDGDGL
jgi:hypothetical protein